MTGAPTPSQLSVLPGAPAQQCTPANGSLEYASAPVCGRNASAVSGLCRDQQQNAKQCERKQGRGARGDLPDDVHPELSPSLRTHPRSDSPYASLHGPRDRSGNANQVVQPVRRPGDLGFSRMLAGQTPRPLYTLYTRGLKSCPQTAPCWPVRRRPGTRPRPQR